MSTKRIKKSPAKKSTGLSIEKPVPRGDPGNPHPLADEDVLNLREGVTAFYLVEEKVGSKWTLICYETTNKRAVTEKNRATKRRIELVAREREAYWRNDNTHTQQSIQLTQFKVTKNTKDADIEQFVDSLKTHRKRLKDNPPVKPPKSWKPVPGDADYPNVRMVVVYVDVKREVLE